MKTITVFSLIKKTRWQASSKLRPSESPTDQYRVSVASKAKNSGERYICKWKATQLKMLSYQQLSWQSRVKYIGKKVCSSANLLLVRWKGQLNPHHMWGDTNTRGVEKKIKSQLFVWLVGSWESGQFAFSELLWSNISECRPKFTEWKYSIWLWCEIKAETLTFWTIWTRVFNFPSNPNFMLERFHKKERSNPELAFRRGHAESIIFRWNTLEKVQLACSTFPPSSSILALVQASMHYASQTYIQLVNTRCVEDIMGLFGKRTLNLLVFHTAALSYNCSTFFCRISSLQ